PVSAVAHLGGGGAGHHLVLSAALPADDRLLAQVAALPPATDQPEVDPVAAARPDPDFRLARFVRPWRPALLAGVVLVAVDALAGLAGPALVRTGVSRGATGGHLATVSLLFAAVALAGRWVLWAQTRWPGPPSGPVLSALR